MFELVYHTQWPAGVLPFAEVDPDTFAIFAEWRRTFPGLISFQATRPNELSLNGYHRFDSEESCSEFEEALLTQPQRVIQSNYEHTVGLTRTVMFRGPI